LYSFWIKPFKHGHCKTQQHRSGNPRSQARDYKHGQVCKQRKPAAQYNRSGGKLADVVEYRAENTGYGVDIDFLNTAASIIMTIKDASPPERLTAPATGPFVASTKKDFKNAIANAYFLLIKNKAYITAMFARPNLMPGKAGNTGGKEASTAARITAEAKSNADSTKFLYFIFILLPHNGVQAVTVFFCRYYFKHDCIGQTCGTLARPAQFSGIYAYFVRAIGFFKPDIPVRHLEDYIFILGQ
jgi:hypothetical protein